MICGIRTGQQKKQRKSRDKIAEKNISIGILARKNKAAQLKRAKNLFVSSDYFLLIPNKFNKLKRCA